MAVPAVLAPLFPEEAMPRGRAREQGDLLSTGFRSPSVGFWCILVGEGLARVKGNRA